MARHMRCIWHGLLLFVGKNPGYSLCQVQRCSVIGYDSTGDASRTQAQLRHIHILVHALTAGSLGCALFHYTTEVECKPIYRDPEHDFGFIQYDPASVKYAAMAEIPLFPAGAQVGVSVRVVGNDAGEKMSILNGTISRIDREAPAYGSNTYNESNTFYIASASSTSGGSSGSPVLDIMGRAVAINAGGKTSAASSFFLPLHRVARALACIRSGLQVPRGGLLGIWEHQPFDAVRRHGLQAETEAWVRSHAKHEHGMLVLSSVLKQGPLDQAGFIPGDVLVAINPRFQQTMLPDSAASGSSPAMHPAEVSPSAAGLQAIEGLGELPRTPELASQMAAPVPTGPPGTPMQRPASRCDSEQGVTASKTLPGTQPITHFLPLEEVCDNTLAVAQAVKQQMLPLLRAVLKRELSVAEIDAAIRAVASEVPSLVPEDGVERDELRERCCELWGPGGVGFLADQGKLDELLSSAAADSQVMSFCAEPGIGSQGWGLRAAVPSLPAKPAWKQSYVGICHPGAHDECADAVGVAPMRTLRELSPLSSPTSDIDATLDVAAGAHMNTTAAPRPLTRLAEFLPPRVLRHTSELARYVAEELPWAEPTPARGPADAAAVAGRKLPTLADINAHAVRGYDRSVRAGESLLRAIARIDFAAAALLTKLREFETREDMAVGSERIQAASALMLAVAQLNPVVDLVVERGGQRVCRAVQVANLHAAMPRRMCELSNAIMHDMSLTLATNMDEPLCRNGVFLAYGGYMFGQAGVPPHAILRAVGDVQIRCLADVQRAFGSQPDNSRLPVRYSTRSDVRNVRTAIVKLDRHWAAAGTRWRCDATGIWDWIAWPPVPPTQTVHMPTGTVIKHSLPGVPEAVQAAFNACTIVKVSHAVLPDGLHGTKFRGVGLLLDAKRGLVLVDRSTASCPAGDMWVTLTGTVEVEARPVFFHPQANFAILAMSKAGLSDSSELPAAAAVSTVVPAVGSKCTFVGMSNDGEPVVHTATVTKVAHAIQLPNRSPPRYRSMNETVLTVDRVVSCLGGLYLNDDGEVIAFLAAYSFNNADGSDDEMWGAMPLALPMAALHQLQAAAPASKLLLPPPMPAPGAGSAKQSLHGLPTAPQWMLDVEWRPVPLADAVSGLGLAEKWANTVTASQGTRRQLMAAARIRPDTLPAGLLQPGDLLLSIEGYTPTTPQEVLTQLLRATGQFDPSGAGALQAPLQGASVKDAASPLPGAAAAHSTPAGEAKDSKEGTPLDASVTDTLSCSPAAPLPAALAPQLQLRILRDGKEQDVCATLRRADGIGTTRVILWAGMILQSAQDSCFAWGHVPSTGPQAPYISRWSYGSPCHRHGIRAAQWLTQLDSTPLHNLDDLMQAIRAAARGAGDKSGTSIAMRLRTETLRGKAAAHTIRTDSTYWPFVELTRDAWGSWDCKIIPMEAD